MVQNKDQSVISIVRKYIPVLYIHTMTYIIWSTTLMYTLNIYIFASQGFPFRYPYKP